MAQTYKPGDRVTYRHEHRGGYGYVSDHSAVVVRTTAKRVTIRMARRGPVTGGYFPVEKSVTVERLRPRENVVAWERILEGGGQ